MTAKEFNKLSINQQLHLLKKEGEFIESYYFKFTH